MSKRLTRDNLHGVWAAIATPWDESGRFDKAEFRENIRRLAAAGVHGIYTTDSDGEFYAIELDEFKQIVKVFADEAGRLGVPTMVGVTWVNTQGIIDRIQYAASVGILGTHVGRPFFMPMTPESDRAYWQDIQKATPEHFGLVHHNTARVHNTQNGHGYAELIKFVPQLIGSKNTSSDVREFMHVVTYAPQIAHLTGEGTVTPFMMLGAKGVNSWFVNFNPEFMLDWYDDAMNRRWNAAIQKQQRMYAFMEAKKMLAGSGNLHGIVSKATAAASPFLIESNVTRKPYLPVPKETVAQFRRVVEEKFQDLMWRG